MMDTGERRAGVCRSLDGLVGDLCADLAKKTDDTYAEAITRVLGDEWTIEDVRGRMERIRTIHSKCETVLLDGKPVLEIYDPTHDVAEGNIFRSTVKFRFLV